MVDFGRAVDPYFKRNQDDIFRYYDFGEENYCRCDYYSGSVLYSVWRTNAHPENIEYGKAIRTQRQKGRNKKTDE